MAQPVKSVVQLSYQEGPKLSMACLRNRIERLEEINLSLVSRVLKLEGAMSQAQEHLDKVFTLETDVDMLGDILYDLQHKSK